LIEILKTKLQKMEAGYRRKIVDTRSGMVTLGPEESFCPKCFDDMKIQKSRPRYIATIKYGCIDLRILTLVCKAGCLNADGTLVTRNPQALYKLVPKGSNFSYDIEVFVGIERYSHHRQREEIQNMLKTEHDIPISTGEISNLAKRFLGHLQSLHLSCSEELKKAMAEDGGYPLNIDATGEAGSGTLFVAYTDWRGWVLGSWRLTTECADQIKPCLEETLEGFGIPVAIMRDFGKAVIPAAKSFVEDLDEDINILGCHSHFLKDIGKDLLEASYDELRKLLRSYGLKAALQRLIRGWGQRLGIKAKEAREDIKEWTRNVEKHQIPSGATGLSIIRSFAQWVLDYSAESENLRFPFDRPYLDFYKRCKILRRAIDAYLRRPPTDPDVLCALKRLARVIDPVIADRSFYHITQTLSKRVALFDKLRKTLRLHPKADSPKQNATIKSEQQKAFELIDIRQSLKKFKESLIELRPKRGPGHDLRKAIDIILDHIERHGDSLWGHVINLPIHAGGGIRVINRTNNGLEFQFSHLKCGERRRSGRKVLTQDMENLSPASMLVSNLNHPDYVEIVCGSLDRLPEVFAKLDMEESNNILEQEPTAVKIDKESERVETASLSNADRSFIRKALIGEQILAAASSRAPKVNPLHF
jgi:hypothetical protein